MGKLYFLAYQHTCSISTIPISIPGTSPAISSAPTLVPDTTPYIIRGRLGGIMGPMEADAQVRAVAYSLSYPCSVIISISIGPNAATSATAEPVTPANIMEATIFICAIPPLNLPTHTFAKWIILPRLPPLSIIFPASMNRGIATCTNVFIPENWRCRMVQAGRS